MKNSARLVGLAALMGFSICAAAQDQSEAPPSLRNLLVTKYKLTRTAYGSNGTAVVEAGSVFVLKKGGLLGVIPQSFGRCPAQFKDGTLQPPGRFCIASYGQNARFLDVGEKVYIIKFDVNVKKSAVTLDLMECDACNGVAQPLSYKSQVIFTFAPKFLDTAEPGQVADVIDQVLGPETASGAQLSGPATAPPPQPTAPAPPAQIQLGDSPAQVEAILGPPDTKAVAGSKVIYVYKTLKVTFVADKAVDIQ